MAHCIRYVVSTNKVGVHFKKSLDCIMNNENIKIYSRKLIHARLFSRSRIKKNLEWEKFEGTRRKGYCIKWYTPLNCRCAEFRNAN